MVKRVEVLRNHKASEDLMLKRSLQRSPEERILWLINQNRLMHKLNPLKKKSAGFELPRKDG